MPHRSMFSRLPLPCLLALLLGCDASPTARVSSLKLSSAEVGTIEAISRSLNSASRDVKAINKSLAAASQAKEQRNYGIADDFYDQANKVLYKWRDRIVASKNNRNPRIVYPQSMAELGEAWRQLFLLRETLPDQGLLSGVQLNSILERLRAVVQADSNFVKSTSSRKVNPDLVQPKVSLMLELRPFPFKLELIRGELKIKKSFAIGNLRGDFGLANSGSRTGITTLILVHAGNARYYAVGNRKLTFEVPACRVDINGQTMTITTLD